MTQRSAEDAALIKRLEERIANQRTMLQQYESAVARIYRHMFVTHRQERRSFWGRLESLFADALELASWRHLGWRMIQTPKGRKTKLEILAGWLTKGWELHTGKPDDDPRAQREVMHWQNVIVHLLRKRLRTDKAFNEEARRERARPGLRNATFKPHPESLAPLDIQAAHNNMPQGNNEVSND